MSELSQLGDRMLVIFDGHCGLCNRSVRWLLVRDRQDRLRFAPSSLRGVATLLGRHGIEIATDATGPSTILVAQDVCGPAERLLTRSEAVLALLCELPAPWPGIAMVLRFIPRPLRDLVYRLVARFRYRVWGRLETCPIPTAQERERILECTDAPSESC